MAVGGAAARRWRQLRPLPEPEQPRPLCARPPLHHHPFFCQIFSLETLVVKFVSCAAAVASGLPVGPEGPMVHIGALVGSGLSQGQSSTLGFSTSLFQRFRNPKDKRDFVAAGTAVGVATAFGAPVGGLLFAFEELSVPFSPALAAQIFFACVAAVLTLDTARSAQKAATTGHFGLLDGDASTVFFEVRTQLANHVAAMVPAVLIGALCGAIAIAFTAVNLRVARARETFLAHRPRGWRVAEPLLLMALFASASILRPAAGPCAVRRNPSQASPPEATSARRAPARRSTTQTMANEERAPMRAAPTNSARAELPSSQPGSAWR